MRIPARALLVPLLVFLQPLLHAEEVAPHALAVVAEHGAGAPISTPVRPRNVILIIGDGMGFAQLAAARYQKGELVLEAMRHAGFSYTHSHSNFVTDSSAGATALATGCWIVNGVVGIAPDGSQLKNIVEHAEEAGMWTGLVATSRITHATPASMAAHVPSRGNEEAIAEQLAAAGLEVILGGGWDMFLPAPPPKAPSSTATLPGTQPRFAFTSAMESPAPTVSIAADVPLIGEDGNPYGTRKDARNLVSEMEKGGYRFVRTAAELSLVCRTPVKVLGLFHSGPLPRVTQGRSPSLAAMSLAALRILSRSPKGFFLLIEGSQIDWAGHDNDYEYAVGETADLDTAVGAILRFLEAAGIAGETLVVVTADHETGGLSLCGNPKLPLGVEPRWATKDHTGAPVPIFAAGPRAEAFSGIQDHASVGRALIRALAVGDVSFPCE